MNKSINIMFTCVGRRGYLLEYFKEELNNYGKIIAVDMQLSAPALIHADYALKVPPVYASNYIKCLLDICRKHNVGAIISLNDLELPVLASHKDEFIKNNIKLIISSSEVIDLCFDKWRTYQFALNNNIMAPKTYIDLNMVYSELDDKTIRFPLVIKPRWGSASIGVEYVNDIKQLEAVYKLVKNKISDTILFEASKKDYENAILIQERIVGKEYGMDILNDFDGNTRMVVVKEKMAMRAGETDKAKICNNDELVKIGYVIGRSLKHIGNMDCDVFERDGLYYLLELNPRFGGGYPFSHAAGANYPKAILNWLLGRNDDNILQTRLDYDKVFAKYDKIIEVIHG